VVVVDRDGASEGGERVAERRHLRRARQVQQAERARIAARQRDCPELDRAGKILRAAFGGNFRRRR
jgi:hypothetical protein